MAAKIDLTSCEQAYDRFYASFVSGAAVVAADFTATLFCDCAALRRLLTVQQRAAARGAQLRADGPAGSRSGSAEMSSRTGPGGAGSSVPQSATGRAGRTLAERNPGAASATENAASQPATTRGRA